MKKMNHFQANLCVAKDTMFFLNYRNIVDLQCSGSSGIQQSNSLIHIIYIFWIHFHYSLLHDSIIPCVIL